jgi:Protein of unknown function (DUF2764).
MSGNYHYIVTGLPLLVLDNENKAFSYDKLRQALREQLPLDDLRWVDWLDFGMNPSCLGPHFYRAALRQKNPFICAYFDFDLKLRNTLAAFSARKAGIPLASVILPSHDPDFDQALLQSRAADFGLRQLWEPAARLFSILENPNLLQREEKIDQLRWDEATRICTFHYFNINTILGFLLKAALVQRWMLLDKDLGQERFQALVKELNPYRPSTQ